MAGSACREYQGGGTLAARLASTAWRHAWTRVGGSAAKAGPRRAAPEDLEPAQVQAAEREGHVGAVQQRQLHQRREDGQEVQHVPERGHHAQLALRLLPYARASVGPPRALPPGAPRRGLAGFRAKQRAPQTRDVHCTMHCAGFAAGWLVRRTARDGAAPGSGLGAAPRRGRRSRQRRAGRAGCRCCSAVRRAPAQSMCWRHTGTRTPRWSQTAAAAARRAAPPSAAAGAPTSPRATPAGAQATSAPVGRSARIPRQAPWLAGRQQRAAPLGVAAAVGRDAAYLFTGCARQPAAALNACARSNAQSAPRAAPRRRATPLTYGQLHAKARCLQAAPERAAAPRAAALALCGDQLHTW